VRQSGNSAPVHRRISKAGRAHVRGVLVEAAWSASRTPGPLRAFYQRVKARRGFQKAVVAHRPEDDHPRLAPGHQRSGLRFARPGLVTHKRRKLELAAGSPSRRGIYRLPGVAYNDKQRPNEEKAAAEQAERSYEVLVATGNSENRPTRGAWVDDFIRRIDQLSDLDREVEERHEPCGD